MLDCGETDAVSPLADTSQPKMSNSNEVLRTDVVSQEKEPSEKEARTKIGKAPRINRAAQQAMFKKRQLNVKSQSNPEIISLEDDQLHLKISGSSQRSNSKLEISNILLNETSWLTCTVIDEAQHLLKVLADNKFGGFQSVSVGVSMQFEIQEREFIQILHCNSGHWLTISTIGCNPSEVLIYDSLYSGASECVQCQIATLLASPSRHITLKFVDVQMQSGTYDCGLFAVAFATALVLGCNPGQYFFNQRSMRKHLWSCIKNQKISIFPVIKERRGKQKVKATQQISLHCFCRLPDLSGIPMIECSRCITWYHTNICVQVHKKFFMQKTEWNCPKCSS